MRPPVFTRSPRFWLGAERWKKSYRRLAQEGSCCGDQNVRKSKCSTAAKRRPQCHTSSGQKTATATEGTKAAPALTRSATTPRRRWDAREAAPDARKGGASLLRSRVTLARCSTVGAARRRRARGAAPGAGGCRQSALPHTWWHRWIRRAAAKLQSLQTWAL